jgi:hypothetical protein
MGKVKGSGSNTRGNMRRLFLICALATALPLAAPKTLGQTTSSTSPADATNQDQLIGEVTSIDTASGHITIRTDTGKSISFKIGEETIYLRVAPGERTLENAGRITRADLKVGDRVLVRGGAMAVDGKPALARQVIVVNKEAQDRQERDREDWRRRGIAGRIAALNPETKEITVAARSREGLETIIINASGNTRLLRYAPDTVRISDARPSSFAELKVGDQLRARGDRSSDGTHFTPEEIIAGSFTRASGTVTGADAAKGEIKIKEEQTGKSLTVVFGKNSTLRRLPPDFVETLMQRTAERRPASGSDSTNAQTSMRPAEQAGRNPNEGENSGARERRGGGRNFQQLLESLPALIISDLKKGDVIILTGTSAASDQSRITTIMLITGDLAVMKRLQQFQGRDGGLRNMSPGLPGDVIGGGTGERERP